MLVLARKTGESVRIGATLEVKVLAVHGNRVKLGFTGPPNIEIYRTELCAAGRRFAKNARSPQAWEAGDVRDVEAPCLV